MICKSSENCSYYNTYSQADSRQHRLLIESYCKGDLLKQKCRRQEYELIYSRKAPDALAPNGYLVGTHKKIRIEDSRKHKRHMVKDCVCLLQIVDTKRTFSAWMVDISEGGVQLELNANPEDLEISTKSNQLRILGYSTTELPVSPTKDTLKMAWQNNRLLGCYFVAA
jgi:hypothetical protein